MAKEELYEIAYRSNINHRKTSENEVIIYEDHRTILNILLFAKEKRNIEESFDVVMFDKHDDFCDLKPSALEKINEYLEDSSKEKLYQLVEFNLAPLDDDWVKAGMELGLINNVFLFNATDTRLGFLEEYETQNFGTKKFYNIGEVWGAIGYHGILNDITKEEYQTFWEDFGWILDNGKFEFGKERRKFVFDIDLDCFSTSVMDKTISIPYEIITEKLNEVKRPIYHHYYTPLDFIKTLISDSEFSTLCFENSSCGGFRESHKIFNLVDEQFFDRELG